VARRALHIGAALVVLTSTAAAQVDEPPPAAPPEAPRSTSSAEDVRRAFDFWLGEWDVTDQASGAIAGSNRITTDLNGQLILEHWIGRAPAGGGGAPSEGMSMNFFDASKKKWVQVWVDASGGVIEAEGEWKDGSMSFVGEHAPADGSAPRPMRFRFTPRDDGTVHQFIEESTDGGTTWATWFDGVYRRRAPDAPPIQTPPERARPADWSPSHLKRQFDFLIGRWEAFDGRRPNTTVSSEARAALGGHLIVERRVDSQGASAGAPGASLTFLFVNPATRRWKQVQADDLGGSSRSEGARNGAAIEFTGRRSLAGGASRQLKTVITLNTNGTVLNHATDSTNGGRDWQIAHFFKYIREGETAGGN